MAAPSPQPDREKKQRKRAAATRAAAPGKSALDGGPVEHLFALLDHDAVA